MCISLNSTNNLDECWIDRDGWFGPTNGVADLVNIDYVLSRLRKWSDSKANFSGKILMLAFTEPRVSL